MERRGEAERPILVQRRGNGEDYGAVGGQTMDMYYKSITHLHFANKKLLEDYVTDATVAKQGTPRTFTPSEMPVKAVDPDCGAPPVFVVQGALERRLKEQLAWVLRQVEALLLLLVLTFALAAVSTWGQPRCCS